MRWDKLPKYLECFAVEIKFWGTVPETFSSGLPENIPEFYVTRLDRHFLALGLSGDSVGSGADTAIHREAEDSGREKKKWWRHLVMQSKFSQSQP